MIDLTTLRGAVEALLFVSDYPLTIEKICELVNQDKELVNQVIIELQEEYREKERGFQLREIGGGFRLMTHPGYASYIEKLVISKDYRRITQAAMETLAIIAYRQPITRQEISNVRGVNAEAAIHSLVEKNLVEEKGRETGPGLPILYGTTMEFLESFGLNSISELMPLEEFEPDEQTKEQIQRKLQEVSSEQKESITSELEEEEIVPNDFQETEPKIDNPEL